MVWIQGIVEWSFAHGRTERMKWMGNIETYFKGCIHPAAYAMAKKTTDKKMRYGADNMDIRVSKELEKILENTTKLSFPMFADRNQKRERLDTTKQEIEEKVFSILGLDDSARLNLKKTDLWEAAEKSACKQFDTLPESLKINSFYLQEVMHTYVESIIFLLQNKGG